MACPAVTAAVPSKTLVDFIDPEHAGSHRFGPLDGFSRSCLTGAHQAGEQASHIQSEQRHGPAACNRFGGEGLAGALGTHKKHAPGHRQAETACLIREGSMTLLQPVFESVETSDRLSPGGGRAELQHLASSDRLPLLFEHLFKIGRAKTAAPCQSTGSHLADPQLAQTAAGEGELLENSRFKRRSGALADAAQQEPQIVTVRQRQVKQR